MPDARRPTHAQRARQAAAYAAYMRRLVEEACNEGNLAVLDEVTGLSIGSGAAALLPLRQRLIEFRAAVPAARWTIVEQIAEGDAVVTRLSVRGTFSGPLVGLAPPGRAAIVTGVAIGRFSEGRLAGLWLQVDLLGLLQQLGVLPPLGIAKAVTMAQVSRIAALMTEEFMHDMPPLAAADTPGKT
ncbi:MAG: ester cyclase [Chloroflexota bacterium]